MSETYSLITREAVMVSPNSINILLILICLLLRFSIGHSPQVKKRTVGADVKLQAERPYVKAEEQMQQGVAGETEERTSFGGGRRTMETTRRLSKAIRSQHWINAEASSTTSGKVHCIGTGDSNGGRHGCVKRKFGKRSRSILVDMSGFVSWNADYNVPRPHPPRNN